MSDIIIKSSSGTYPIKFQSIRQDIFENSFLLVDQMLQDLHGLDNNRSVFVSVNERNKTLSLTEGIIINLSEKGMTKKDNLVVIGGGFLQDIGTIISSLYMRGVPWIYVPTTLASMGDSCMGGKSSINAGEFKNLVGNFYPPNMVLIDPSFISTLQRLEVIAGLAEITKICFAKSWDDFKEVTRLISDWVENRNNDSLSEIIQLSLNCKKHFVEQDEFDTGIRKLLNFGHSFGHALEAASNFTIPHGVAVLVGMISACLHPMSRPSNLIDSFIDSCLSYARLVGKDLEGLLSNIDLARFSQALAKDKKNSSTHLVLVLPQVNGLEVVSIPFESNALETATETMKFSIEMVLNEIR